MKKPIMWFLIIWPILFACMWIWSVSVKTNFLLLGGSTSCNTFMQNITGSYEKEVIYSSVGSQAGINGYQNNSFDAGFVSFDISSHNDWSNKTKEKIDYNKNDLSTFENQVKSKKTTYSFEFALDAIIMIVHFPDWWSLDLKNISSFFSIDNNYKNSELWLKKIYEKNYTWENFANDLIDYRGLNKNDYNIPTTNTNFITFTREPGSGTRDAFTNLTNAENQQSANVVNSNGIMLASIESNTGSIGYISYAFNKNINNDSAATAIAFNDVLLGNSTLSDEDHYYVFDKNSKTFKTNGDATNEDAISDDIYKMQRPFICLFTSSNSKIDQILKFLEFMQIDQSKKIYDDNGLVFKPELIRWD